MLTQRTLNYAAPPKNYFWAWSADHDAAEWHDGSTLGFWQELHGVLQYLGTDGGLPPLGSLLMVLAACKDDWISQCIAFNGTVKQILGAATNEEIPPEVRYTITRDLRIIHELPKELRSSFSAKCHLASALFEGGPYSVSREDSGKILRELSIHGPAILSGQSTEMPRRARFIRDMRALRVGLARHSAESLEALLRTGLEHEVSLADPLTEEGEDRDSRPLLARLEDRRGEEGAVAAIAKQAIAMIGFPGGFRAPEDLPVGGIGDITNRGTVDRLLPGELAWDDLVLAVRLVHNEALYFRREVPPSRSTVRHTVLLDRTIRLWGTARVFSLGVALGMRHHPALSEPGLIFDCHAATSDGCEALDLVTPAGVRAALEALVPAPHPRVFLSAWWAAAMAAEEAGVVPDLSYITAMEHLGEAETSLLLGRISGWIHERAGRFRVIALGRTGAIRMDSWSPAGTRELFRGELALDRILAVNHSAPEDGRTGAPAPLRAKPDPLHERLPFYAVRPMPVYFPQIPQGCAILHGASAADPILGVTSERALMSWPREGWGGIEMIPKIPGRQHWMGRDEGGEVIIIASGEEAGQPVRVFRLDGERLHEIDVEPSMHPFPRKAKVANGVVLLAYSERVEALSLTTGRRVATLDRGISDLKNPVMDYNGYAITLVDAPTPPMGAMDRWPFGDPTWPRMFPYGGFVKEPLLTGGYDEGHLGFYPMELAWKKCLPLQSTGEPLAFTESEFSPVEGVKLRFCQVGPSQELWLDPRGLLHLRDTGGETPEVWTVLLSKEASAAWHPRWGLCASDARLRAPGAGEPRELTLVRLRDFMSDFKKACSPNPTR